MTVLEGVCIGLAVVGLSAAGLCARQLYRWERLLRGARIVIGYKGKVKDQHRLIDYLRWAQTLDSDKSQNGHTIFAERGLRLALLKPVAKTHGKTVTTTRADST